MAFCTHRLEAHPRLLAAAQNNPPLRQGEKGEAVRAYQLALIDIGYEMPKSTGNGSSLPDGIFGAETVSVTKAFQKNANLTVDGVAGRQTLQALDVALRWVSDTETAACIATRPRFGHEH